MRQFPPSLVFFSFFFVKKQILLSFSKNPDLFGFVIKKLLLELIETCQENTAVSDWTG